MSTRFLRQALPPPMLCPTCIAVVQPQWNATRRAVWVALLSLAAGLGLTWLVLGSIVVTALDAFLVGSLGVSIGLLVMTVITDDFRHNRTKDAYRNVICPHCHGFLFTPPSPQGPS